MLKASKLLDFYLGHQHILKTDDYKKIGKTSWRDYLILSTKKFDLEQTNHNIKMLEQNKAVVPTLEDIKNQHENLAFGKPDYFEDLHQIDNYEIKIGHHIRITKNKLRKQ